MQSRDGQEVACVLGYGALPTLPGTQQQQFHFLVQESLILTKLLERRGGESTVRDIAQHTRHLLPSLRLDTRALHSTHVNLQDIHLSQ